MLAATPSSNASLPLALLSLVARTPREQQEILARAISAARTDPAELAPLVFSTDLGDPMVPEPFHREWLRLMREGPRYLQILAPRGHAKSEYLALVYLAWYLAVYPERRVLLVSSTDDMAQRFALRIGEVFTHSEAFARVFPDLPKVTKATQHEVRFESSPRDPALRAVGWGTTVTGARADLILLEDIATNENQSEDAQRKKMKDFLLVTLLPILVPQIGQIRATGTPYRMDDIYVALREQAGFAEYVYDCYVDGNEHTPLWPERFPTGELQQTAKRIGVRNFSSQYRCVRTSQTGEVYNADWFPLAKDLPSMREQWLVFDSAFSTRTSADYFAIVLLGLGVDNDVYIQNCWRGKWGADEAKRIMTQVYRARLSQWHVKLKGFLAEDTKENRVVQAWFKNDDTTKDVKIVLDKWDNRDKYSRASDIVPYCEGRRVKLLTGAYVDDFLNEILAFTKNDMHAHDDQHDCMVLGVRRLLSKQAEPRIRFL